MNLFNNTVVDERRKTLMAEAEHARLISQASRNGTPTKDRGCVRTATSADAQLAEQRRHDLIAESVQHRRGRPSRWDDMPRTESRGRSTLWIVTRSRSALRAWYATGQL
jgi:hypothetical protein